MARIILVFIRRLWLPLLVCIFFLRYFTHEPSLLDPPTIGSTYLGIGLLGALYISLGCFASSLTKNQIVAAMVSFSIGFALFAISRTFIRTISRMSPLSTIVRTFA